MDGDVGLLKYSYSQKEPKNILNLDECDVGSWIGPFGLVCAVSVQSIMVADARFIMNS